MCVLSVCVCVCVCVLSVLSVLSVCILVVSGRAYVVCLEALVNMYVRIII